MEKQKLTIYNADTEAIKRKFLFAGDRVKLCDLKPNEEFIINGKYGRIKVAAKQYVSYTDFALNEHSTTNTQQYVYKANWNWEMLGGAK